MKIILETKYNELHRIVTLKATVVMEQLQTECEKQPYKYPPKKRATTGRYLGFSDGA